MIDRFANWSLTKTHQNCTEFDETSFFVFERSTWINKEKFAERLFINRRIHRRWKLKNFCFRIGESFTVKFYSQTSSNLLKLLRWGNQISIIRLKSNKLPIIAYHLSSSWYIFISYSSKSSSDHSVVQETWSLKEPTGGSAVLGRLAW